MYAQLTRCFSAVADLLVIIGMRHYDTGTDYPYAKYLSQATAQLCYIMLK